MSIELETCRIINFKSFRDTGHVKLNKFNVLIGPNGSGKTNFVDFFKFLKKALVEVMSPHVPHLEWWSCKTIAWKNNERLPIGGELKFKLNNEYDIHYTVFFSCFGDSFKIISERLTIEGIIKLERAGRVLKVIHDDSFIESNRDEINRWLKEREYLLLYPHKKIIPDVDNLKEQTVILPSENRSILSGHSASYSYRNNLVLGIFSYSREQEFIAFSPALERKIKVIGKDGEREEKTIEPLLTGVLHELHSFIGRTVILRHPNVRAIQEPVPIKKEIMLKEDGSNLVNILYNWFIEKGKLPDRIEYAIRYLFPRFKLGFDTSYPSNIFMKVFEADTELLPPAIPDGFYKTLLILTAIEQKPSLLIIDEVENSLHAEILEYLVDELKNSDTTVIITTHSPIVIDMVELEDLLIVEKNEETKLRRVEDPDKVRSELEELGITPSESWLYGKL